MECNVLNFNEKDFNSVMLGGLLHDIGKFTMKQIENRKKGIEHPSYSEEFFNTNMSYLKDRDWIDFETVKTMLKRHHTFRGFADEYLVQKIDDERIRKLAFLVSKADNISSSERYDKRYDQKTKGNQRNPMDSMFSEITLYKDTPKAYFNYEISPLQTENIFPQKGDKRKQFTDLSRAKETYEEFCDVIRGLSSKNFKAYYNSLLSILVNYLWAVPSDLSLKISDISLFDHLKTTSAIATVLYFYHLENGFDEKEIMNKRFEYKSMLLGGDLSNIQKYIYDISSIGAGGVAKRLRGRSFYLSMFLETIVHKILDRFNLPYSCCLFIAGGNFLLLLPNLKEIEQKLEDLEREIMIEIRKKHFCQFGITLNWKKYEYKEGCADDSLLVEKDFAIYNFFEKTEDMLNALEEKKNHSIDMMIRHSDSWVEDIFEGTEMYQSYHAEGDCKVCGKGPASYNDEKEDKRRICQVCHNDKNILGKRLTCARYVGFSNEPAPLSNSIELLGPTNEHPGYYLTLIKDKDNKIENKEEYLRNNFYLLYDLNKLSKDNWKGIETGLWVSCIANHIPLFRDYNEMHIYCTEVCKKEGCDYKEEYEKKYEIDIKKGKNLLKKDNIPYSFNCMASVSKSINGTKGSQFLGILKADIDRLGLIFTRGFKELNQYDKDRKTISRYLTLSRMIEHFFSLWVENSMNNILMTEEGEQYDFSKIYTVYSGGDDLVLIGPWETIIYYTRELYRNFKDFVCMNDNISLSAGIAIIKPKFPISKGVAIADKYLKKSKNEGRDKVTIFGITIKWDELDEVIDFKNLLHKELNDGESPLNKAFLNRLFIYYRKYQEARSGKIENLIYHSQLAYDIERNIVEKAKDVKKAKDKDRAIKQFKQKNELYKNLLRLLCLKDEKDKTMLNNLMIPLSWVIYKNRS